MGSFITASPQFQRSGMNLVPAKPFRSLFPKSPICFGYGTCTFNFVEIPNMMQGIFLDQAILATLGIQTSNDKTCPAAFPNHLPQSMRTSLRLACSSRPVRHVPWIWPLLSEAVESTNRRSTAVCCKSRLFSTARSGVLVWKEARLDGWHADLGG